jgi:hypothetical protein
LQVTLFPGQASFQAVCKAGQKAVHLVGYPPGAVVLVGSVERIEHPWPVAFSEDGLSLLTPAELHRPGTILSALVT